MSKRLILVVCALFMVAMAVPAYAAVQNIKVSGDINARYIIRNDFDLAEDSGAGADDQISVFNTITRVKIDADLTDNVQTVVRLINERNWDVADTTNTDVDLDLAYVTMKEFLFAPLTLAIGRQELHFGNDMIIGARGTNQTANYTEAAGYASLNGDLSARKAFDAIRGTMNFDPLVVDVVFAKLDENLVTGSVSSDDVDLFGVNANLKVGGDYNVTLEGYFWSRISQTNYSGAVTADKADTLHTIGGRVALNPMERLTLQQEVAHQFGKFADGGITRDRNAWASQSMATLGLDMKFSPVVGIIYSYFSGDADFGTTGTDPEKDYRAWDPMFENQTAGHIINALFGQTNCQNLDVMMSLQLADDISFRADYVLQTLAKASTVDIAGLNDYGTPDYRAEKKDLGQEIDLALTYDYTEDVQFGLLTGWFFPGKALNKAQTGGERNWANEAIVSCKVNF